VEAHHDARRTRQQRADGERDDDDLVHIHAHQRRRGLVFGYSAHGASRLGSLHEGVEQHHEHHRDNDDDDPRLGHGDGAQVANAHVNGAINQPGAAVSPLGRAEDIEHGLLQKERGADGADQRGQAGRCAQRAIGDALQDNRHQRRGDHAHRHHEQQRHDRSDHFVDVRGEATHRLQQPIADQRADQEAHGQAEQREEPGRVWLGGTGGVLAPGARGQSLQWQEQHGEQQGEQHRRNAGRADFERAIAEIIHIGKGEPSAERAHNQDFAVCKVDHEHDAVDQRIAQGDEGVDAAQHQAVDQLQTP